MKYSHTKFNFSGLGLGLLSLVFLDTVSMAHPARCVARNRRGVCVRSVHEQHYPLPPAPTGPRRNPDWHPDQEVALDSNIELGDGYKTFVIPVYGYGLKSLKIVLRSDRWPQNEGVFIDWAEVVYGSGYNLDGESLGIEGRYSEGSTIVRALNPGRFVDRIVIRARDGFDDVDLRVFGKFDW
jgi:hypothetical protein